MKKHNTKRTLNAFNRLTLWVLAYFALSVAFAVDVVVVYLFSLAYYLTHKFICILIRSLLYCIAFQGISWHSATFQCILLFRRVVVVLALFFFPKRYTRKVCSK